jgi:hypothetical protein
LSAYQKYFIILLLIFNNSGDLYAEEIPPSKVIFMGSALMLGKNIPNYDSFPDATPRSNIIFDLGILRTDTMRHWVKYYNFPTVGLLFSYSNLGNKDILGNEFSIIPYIIFKTSPNPRKSFDFKVGLGASYYDHPFHPESNPSNKIIGSDFTWTFQLFLYKKLLIKDRINLMAGFGFIHSSNAHTTIPNYGMNSLMISLATQFSNKRYDPDFAVNFNKRYIDKTKHYFIQSRLGYGWHELGGTYDPPGGQDYPVTSFGLSGGIIFRRHLKLGLGFNYRFYRSFYEFILHNTSRTGLGNHPKLEASNVVIFTGLEFLIGHVGIDFEFGYNLHKPFYDEFNSRWEFNEGFKYWRNRYISSRFGLNFYIISNEKMPKHNVFLGSHINANFGKADFMDISIGYTYLVR